MPQMSAVIHGLVFWLSVLSLAGPASAEPRAGFPGGPDQTAPEAEDICLKEVPADRLVRLPYTGNTQVYYPDGYHAQGRGSGRDEEPLVLYRNTLSADTPGVFVLRPGRRARVADDLVTEATAECPLTSLRVMVNGGIEVDEGNVFAARLNLYDSCPAGGGTQVFPVRTNPDRESYITFTNLNAFIEEFPILDLGPLLADLGTCAGDPEVECSFDSQDCPEGLGECVHDFPLIPPTVWVRLRFNSDTAGVVVGTPAQRGFSADAYDHDPYYHCWAWFGGYPRLPHASFWAELHSTDLDECPVHYLAYLAADATKPAFIPPDGPAIRVGDDIHLTGGICELSTYELGIKGVAGPYEIEIDLRWPGINDIIEGTENVFVGRGEGSLEVARFEVPPGLFVNSSDQPIWITWRANRGYTGVVVVGRTQAGSSSDKFWYGGCWCPSDVWPPPCVCPRLPDKLPGIFYASVYCGGWPPPGACCAGEQPDYPDADPLCFDDVSVIGCLEGRWRREATCADGLFDPPCGAQACCLPTGECADLTRNECLAHCEPNDPPIACASDEDCPGPMTCGARQCHDGSDFTRVQCNPEAGSAACPPGQTCEPYDPNLCSPQCASWNSRDFCDDYDFYCPYPACYGAVGDCFIGEALIPCQDDSDCPPNSYCTSSRFCSTRAGCSNLDCCSAICQDDPFCCDVAWDDLCVESAYDSLACHFPPDNDECWDPSAGKGAIEIELMDDDSPDTCWPFSSSCSGSAFANNTYATANLSDPGFCCNNLELDPTGAGTIWYTFTAAHATARIHTCAGSDFDDQNTLIQVFEALDPADEVAACNSLQVIGCNDDQPGCGPNGVNSSICVANLVAGETYYILMASSTTDYQGPYTIHIESPCPASMLPPPNNRCASAQSIVEGLTPFDMEGALFDCPSEPNLPGLRNDLWWQTIAPCTGKLVVDTCWTPEPDDPRPATNLAVYESWTCPPDTYSYRAWFNDDAQFDRHCTISGHECFEDSDCVVGCVGGPDAGELCEIDEECSSGICDTYRQAICVARPEFPDYVATGNACRSYFDCPAGACQNDHVTPCVRGDTTKHCASGDHAGEECVENLDCPPNNDCEPQCGWQDPAAEIPWYCLWAELCELGQCASTCAPGSYLELPAFTGDQFMIRLGGEFGGEPEGWLSVKCEIDDCNANVLPDLWEIENGLAADCNLNGNPDECDIDPTNPGQVDQLSEDCDANEIPDECQIDVDAEINCVYVPPPFPCYDGPTFCLSDCDGDVNENGIPDVCDARCPDGAWMWIDPPNCLVDARQPHSVDEMTPQGFTIFVVEGPPGAEVDLIERCWGLVAPGLNDIGDVVEDPPGAYAITLTHPIAPGELTMITYTTDFPFVNTYEGKFAALPGDVDGNRVVEMADIDHLISCLNGLACAAWQTDINRSGATNARDIVRLLDLFTGAGPYDVWLSQTVPGGCP